MSNTEAIKRALARERSARKQAEAILEDKSRELFATNQQLLSLNASLEKQVQERTQEIEKNAEQLNVMFEEHPIPMMVYGLNDFKFLAANQTAIINYGYSQEEFLQLKISDLYSSKEITNIEAHLDTTRTAISEIQEWKHITSSGKILDVEINATSIIYNEVHAWLVVVKDITDRKLAERERSESDRKYREFVEQASDLIYRCNSKGQFTYVNPICVIRTGYSQEEFVGMKFIDLIRNDYKETVAQFYQDQVKQKELSSYLEFPILDKNGIEIWVGQTVDLSYLNDSQSDFEVTALSRDITDRKNIEGQLVLAKETAEDSVRSKELFMANMSHEIRTPMNAIIGMGELLNKTNLNAKQKEFLGAIETSAENLLIIINDILDFSKIEAGKLELVHSPTDIIKLLKNAAKTVELKAEEKGVSLILDIKKEVRWFSIDPTRLRQVIINLLSNAVKFTDSGSVILKSEIVNVSQNKPNILFSVKDTGIGIAPDKLNNIFESFIQAEENTSQKYGGTGLGLSISKQLVQMMGGELEIKSQLNKGSEFYFTLSLEKSEDRKPTKENKDMSKSENVKGMKVLLVEDHEINRFMAQTILENWECEVSIAVNGKIAVEKVEGNEFDVILMDMRMPEMDGLEATKMIRTVLKIETPIIGLTANAIRGDKEKCLEIGMNDYISKPFKQEDLLEKMSKHYKPKVFSNAEDGIDGLRENVMDLTKLKETTNNDPVFMKKMIQLFIDDTPQQVEAMNFALHEQNWVQVGKIAHKLKPSIDYLANSEMQTQIRSIENISDITSNREMLIQELIRNIDQLISELILAA